MRELVLGTRGSALALWQARHVAAALERANPGLSIELRILKTEGDARKHDLFGEGDRGVFVNAIEKALRDEEVDLAVHSLKDLPTTDSAGLRLGAFPERADARDALLTRDGRPFAELAPGTVVATGSPRRRAQLLYARPDLKTRAIRGNVDTRVDKLRQGRCDALVLAVAGLQRLAIDTVSIEPLDVDLCLPAVGQGALAVQMREADAEASACVARVDDLATRRAVSAERCVLRLLGGGCLAPATAHGRVDGERLRLEARVLDLDGETMLREVEEGRADKGDALGSEVARRLLASGAAALLERARTAETGRAPL